MSVWAAEKANEIADGYRDEGFSVTVRIVVEHAIKLALTKATQVADDEMANEGVDGSSARYVLAALRALSGEP